MGSVRVAIAEDHRVVADALATMLAFEDGYEIVGVVSSAQEIVELTAATRPDVVLMDVGLADGDGIDATRDVLEVHPSCRVPVLSMHDDAETVARAIGAGAAGYLPKNTTRAELLEALVAVTAGDGYLHPSITGAFLERIRPLATEAATSPSALTVREHEVLEHLVDGMSTRQIAGALAVSEETVKTHLTRVYQKLGGTDRVQAVATALRAGIVK